MKKIGRKLKWKEPSKIRTYRCSDQMYDDISYICEYYGYTINGLIISKFKDVIKDQERILIEKNKNSKDV